MDRYFYFGHNRNNNFVNGFIPMVTRKGDYIERTYLKRDGTVGKILSLADDVIYRQRRPRSRDGLGVWRTLHPYESIRQIQHRPKKLKPINHPSRHQNSKKKYIQKNNDSNPIIKRKSISSKNSKCQKKSADKVASSEKVSLPRKSSTETLLNTILSKSIISDSAKSKSDDSKETSQPQPSTLKESFHHLDRDSKRDVINSSAKKKDLIHSGMIFDHHDVECSMCELKGSKKPKKDVKYYEDIVKSVQNEVAALQIVIDKFLKGYHTSKIKSAKPSSDHTSPKFKSHEKTNEFQQESKTELLVIRSNSAPQISKCEQIENKYKDGIDLKPSDLLAYISKCQGSILIPLKSKSSIRLISPNLSPRKTEPMKSSKISKFPQKKKLESNLMKKRPNGINKKNVDCNKRYRLLRLQRPAPMNRVSQYIRDCCLDIFKMKGLPGISNMPELPNKNPKFRKSGGKEVHFAEFSSDNDSEGPSFSSLIRKRMKYYSNDLVSSLSSATTSISEN